MPVGDFAHGGFSEGWGALESPWEWLGGLEVMGEIGLRPAMVLCAPITRPYGSNSCHDLGRLQATRLSGKQHASEANSEPAAAAEGVRVGRCAISHGNTLLSPPALGCAPGAPRSVFVS